MTLTVEGCWAAWKLLTAPTPPLVVKATQLRDNVRDGAWFVNQLLPDGKEDEPKPTT